MPPGAARKAVQCTKVVIGIPFCQNVSIELLSLEMANLPNAHLDM